MVSSINKTDRHDITELLLKVAFNTITLTHVITVFKTLPGLMNVVKGKVQSVEKLF